MENLAPPLHITIEIIGDLKMGLSLESSISRYLEQSMEPRWRRELQGWFLEYKRNSSAADFKSEIKSLYRRTLFDYLEKGLEGHPILKSLEDFKSLLMVEVNREVEEYIIKLPFRGLLPLFLFQFPAFLILFLGPVLSSFLESLK